MNAASSQYSRTYYLAHPQLKEKCREREKQKRRDAKSYRQRKFAISSGEQESKKMYWVEIILLVPLVALITFLLLREMVSFYVSSDSSNSFAWMKAIAIEASVLVLSFLGHSRAFLGIGYRVTALFICCFSILAMSSRHYSSGVSLARADRVTQDEVRDLEKVISSKELQRDLLLSKGWISAAKKTERSIDSLRSDLSQLRAKLIASNPVTATQFMTGMDIVFRILLMLVNILAANHLGLRLRELRNFKSGIKISRSRFEISRPPREISNRRDPPHGGGLGEIAGGWVEKWFAFVGG